MFAESLPRTALREGAAPVRGRLPFALLAAAVPVPLSIGLGVAYGGLTGVSEMSAAGKNVAYGVASLLVVGAVYYGLSRRERAVAFRFERPSREELVWTLVGFPVGSGAYLAGGAIARAVGFEMGGYEYTLADPTTVGAVVFGAVLVAPFAEEVLFRGFLLGSLLGRGVSPLLAGAATVLAFCALHVAVLDVGGVVAVGAWGILPTALRLRFDNLTGATLLHFVNNVWSYLFVVALGIA